MCGIAGATGDHNKKRAALLIASLRHRGPDSHPRVASFGKQVSVAAVRLSIVDLKNGDQPMTDKQSGNMIAFNGEIYNHNSLRKQLRRLGIKFKTKNDTEVLLMGFSFFGPQFVTQLHGIFSVAFYSSSEEALYLFRDFFGVKPLYYTVTNRGIEFASEAKSLTIENNMELDVDFFVYNKILGCSPPERSIFKGINAVIPGTYIKYSNSELLSVKYKPDIDFTPTETFQEAVNLSKKNITESIRSQIPSEVRWGVLLSGGVDSSILTYVASKFCKRKIKTFSIGPEENDTEDLFRAREVAKQLATDHTEIRVSHSNLLAHFADYIFTIEDINTKFFFYYLLSQSVGKSVKVALCGEGADELYAGYPTYRETDKFLSGVKNRFKSMNKLLSTEVSKDIRSIIKNLKKENFAGFYNFMINKQLPYFQLNVIDKCSMRFGVELRVPYLDLIHAVNVMNYPKKYLLEGSLEKNILRRAFTCSNLSTIRRRKVFAGTRTLPLFYKELQIVANQEYDFLKKKHPTFASILNPVELYSLNLFLSKMSEYKQPTLEGIKFIKL